MINYVDDSPCCTNNDQLRHIFEKKLSKRFHLFTTCQCKMVSWNETYIEHKESITLDQDQYVKNITSRFKKKILQTPIQR